MKFYLIFTLEDDFITDSDLRIACTILQKQIEYIDGKKENIIIPSVVMAASNTAILTCLRDANLEMNMEDGRSESIASNLHFVVATNATPSI